MINDDYFRLELTISVSTYLHFVIVSCYANEYQLLLTNMIICDIHWYWLLLTNINQYWMISLHEPPIWVLTNTLTNV